MAEVVRILVRPEFPSPRPLRLLAEAFALPVTGAVDGVELTGIAIASGDVRPGDLFAALPGGRRHGAAFAQAAREAGAVAILTDEAGREQALAAGVPVLVAESPRTILGAVSAWIYRTESDLPTLFGVTGTNGKTTTSYFLDWLLRRLGLVTGMSTTVERRVADLVFRSRLTTPEAPELHGLLARMREAQVRAVSIEVSAQALERGRVDAVVFDVAAFTNLSHDHLDDYGTMDRYFQEKAVLFTPERAKRGVISLESEWGFRLLEQATIPVTTLALATNPRADEADWVVDVLESGHASTRFRLSGPDGRSLETTIATIGTHMAEDAGLALVMMTEAGFDLDVIAQALGEEGIGAAIPGRLERVSGPEGPQVFVDFGHSADAFLKILTAVRSVTPGRLAIVFGVDGDRDPSKRGEMARVAAANSDLVVITDHHPRFEDPASIRATLIAAVEEAFPEKELHEVVPPQQAIRHAVGLLGPGDSIVWAGPGHQDYREIEGVLTPYSARDEARAALREAGWS